MGEGDASKRIRTGRRDEKSTEDGCVQKWKHPEQCVRALTSKALTYCQGNDQSAQFYSTGLITDRVKMQILPTETIGHSVPNNF